MTKCVKRGCLLCVDEVLAAFQKFPAVEKVTESNGGYKEFGFLLCFDLLLYVYGKQLGSCRVFIYVTTMLLGKSPGVSLLVFSAHSFVSN